MTYTKIAIFQYVYWNVLILTVIISGLTILNEKNFNFYYHVGGFNLH
jgi:hypothetical protein